MRPLCYRSDDLRSLLMRIKIATLDELKQALGSSVDVTVFRRIKPLDYLTSYSHRGRYYTLREIARFDEKGLWSHAAVWFSQLGALLATAESFVNRSPRGYFADEPSPAAPDLTKAPMGWPQTPEPRVLSFFAHWPESSSAPRTRRSSRIG